MELQSATYKSLKNKSLLYFNIGLSLSMLIALILVTPSNKAYVNIILALMASGIWYTIWSSFGIRYELGSETLSIRKLLGKVNIPIHEIKEIKVLKPNALKGHWRMGAFTGSQGFNSKFHQPGIGTYMYLGSDPKKAILIVGDKDNYVISPQNSELFLSNIKQLNQDICIN